MSKSINWGLIGLGKMADVFISTLKEVPNSKVKGVASKSPQRIKKISNNLSIDKKYCFNDYYDLIRCEEIDIIYITLPNNLHFHIAQKALENKKHVLVEKPACLKSMEVMILENLALTNKLIFAEGFAYLHNPMTKELLDIIDRGEIGSILRISANIGFEIVPKVNIFSKLLDRFKKENRLFNPEMGGGSIFDLGCYTLSFLQLITNLDNLQIIDKNLYNGFKKVDIDSKIEIQTNNNTRAYLHCSFIKTLDQLIKIRGTEGDIMIKGLWSGDDTAISVNNRIIHRSSKFDIPFSNQVHQINNCIIEDNLIFENLPYSKFNSFNNIELIELWRN